MEKEKTRGRTRRKQPSQVASFLYREGRRWFAAVLSLCLILNNMTGVTWAAQTAGEKEIWFKLTSSSLYEALQEAVRDGEKVNDHFLFEGKENDVEAYEKLLLLDDDLYELKPEFENKDEVEDAENKKNLQLRIFASLSWEIDPEKEYQVAGDEKIIFYLSNGSETEQTAVIQVDEKTTEDITVLSKSAVVIGSENKEESLEAETEEVAETRENEGGENETGESETGESEGQAAEENSGEDVKKQGSGGNSGALSGGNGGNSENSLGGNAGNSGNSGNSTETEISAEGGSFAGSSDEADKAEENKEDVEGEVQENPVEEAEKGQDNADNEEREDSKGSTDIQESIEHQGGEQDKAEESNSAEKDKTNSNSPSESEKSEKPEEEGTEDKKTESVETGNKEDKTSEKIEEDKASEKIESEKTEDEKQENVITENTEDKKSEKSESSKSENANSEKPEKEKTDIKNADTENRDQRKEESERTETVKSDHVDKPDRADKESSKKKTSGKNASENTKAGKEEKADTGKSENDNSGKSDNSKADKSNHSDTSSDNGKEVSAGISRNAILLVTDNLEVSESKDASIADNDSTVVTASPSNTEDDEIEGELYEPVVMDEETVIVFVTTAEELGLSRAELRKASPSNAERISPAFEKEVELENVIVQVKADENILPEGVQLQVKELKEEGEHAAEYEEAKEALDSQGTEYDGMMALDISFLDKKGREIEPDGNVQVAIKVKKKALPEEADLESVSVQHLVEDEGEVFVEEVADNGDKTEGKVEVQAEEHVEAEFEVGSFSVFTVTWVNGNDKVPFVRFTFNAYLLNADGSKTLIDNGILEENIELSKSDLSQKEGENTMSWVFPAEEYFSRNVQGYAYEYMDFSTEPYRYSFGSGSYVPIPDEYGNYQKEAMVTGRANTITVKNVGGWGFPYLVEINKEGATSPIICPGGLHGKMAEITLDVYFSKADLAIIATITDDGRLTASQDLEPGQSYVWYKWSKKDGEECPTINDGTKKIRNPEYQVSPVAVTGNRWNIEQEGKVLNAVYDEGGEHYYLVAIKDNKSGEEIKESSKYWVGYSSALKNGSFEYPSLYGQTKNYDFYDISDDEIAWKTTTSWIEIVRNTSRGNDKESHFLDRDNTRYPGGVPAGVQCAELNAKPEDGSGALYQDVLTAPGATLHWSLKHRARGNQGQFYEQAANIKETMYVIITPAQVVEEMMKIHGKSMDAVKDDIIQNPQNYPDSTRVWELTSSRQDWTSYIGDYVVGKDQYLTRFFFVAGDVSKGSGMASYGNLLDDIHFGTELPIIEDNVGALSVTKVVSGVPNEKMENYSLDVKICKSNKSADDTGKTEDTLTFSQFTSTEEDYSDVHISSGLLPGEYTIEEILPPIQDMPISAVSIVKVEKGADGEEVITPLEVETLNNGNPQAKINIETGKMVSIRITNSYKEEEKGSFTIKKIFENGVGKSSELIAKFKNVQFKLEPVQGGSSTYSYIASMSMKTSVSENEDNKLSVDSNGKDLYGIFEIKDIPAGTYMLTEINTPEGYLEMEPKIIYVGTDINDEGIEVFGCYEMDSSSGEKKLIDVKGRLEVSNKEIPSGTILPDTGGPGLAMFERYGWFLLMLALLMAGVEVRCYGERKYRRASVTQNEEFDAPL